MHVTILAEHFRSSLAVMSGKPMANSICSTVASSADEDDQSLGARKAEKAKPMRRELGQEIERELRESDKWKNNLSMRVHLFCEDYIAWRDQFNSVESCVQWYHDYYNNNPGAEGSPRITGMRALQFALDELEPDLAEAESNRVQLELLKQTQKEIEHQKDVFQGHVETHYSTIAELLRLPISINTTVMEGKKKITQQVGQDRADIELLLTKAITIAMTEVENRLKVMLATSAGMIFQETKNWLCIMYVCMYYVCMYGALARNRKNFKYVLLQVRT